MSRVNGIEGVTLYAIRVDELDYVDSFFEFAIYEDFLWNLADMRVRGVKVAATHVATSAAGTLGHLVPVPEEKTDE